MISWLRSKELNHRIIIFSQMWLFLPLAIGLAGLVWWRISLPANTTNLLTNPDFDINELSGWQIRGEGGGEATLKLATDDGANVVVNLSLPDTPAGSWVGIGQRIKVNPLQRYQAGVNYRLAQPEYSSAKVILQVSQFDGAGKLIKTQQFTAPDFLANTSSAGGPAAWKPLSPLFVTDMRAAVVEVGLGLLGGQATTLEVDNLSLRLNPSWSTALLHDPAAVVAAWGLIILTGAVGYRAGRAMWLNREVLITRFDRLVFGSARRNMLARLDEILARPLLSFKSILLLSGGFGGILVFLNITIRFICLNIVSFSCPVYWPVSVFAPRIPNIQDLLVAGSVALLFILTLRYFSAIASRVFYLVIISILLVLGANLIQGWTAGYSIPITGGGGAYFYDAIQIQDVSTFLNQFEQLQPRSLQNHSSKHPPGAVLAIYFLHSVLQNPNLVSVAIATVAVSLSLIFLYQLLLSEFEPELSKYLVFLFSLIPAIQIYYAASIDALSATFLLGFLYFFRRPQWLVSLIGSIMFLFLASFLTFGIVFLLPVVLGYELLRHKTVLRSGFILFGVGLVYTIIYLLFNFNYFNSFLIASYIEGIRETEGYLPFSDPIAYIPTRLEGILEIILFFGPCLTVIMIAGLRLVKNSSLRLLTWSRLMVLTILGLFAVGVFWTGETARVNLYIYPYLLFPVGAYLANIEVSSSGRELLLILVFTQTLLMQLFGHYHW